MAEEESATPHNVPRARAKAVSPEVKRERMRMIMGLQASGEWTAEFNTRFAEEWGLAQVTVEAMAQESSRILHLRVHDLDAIEEFCRHRLRAIAEMDMPQAVQAIQVLLKNVGRLNDRIDVSVSAGASDEDLIIAVVAKVMRSEKLKGVLLRELRKADPGLFAIDTTAVPLLEEAK